MDCYNAGATRLHIHVRDPKSGHISKNFKEYSEQMARLRKAVPKMILEIGGSISFSAGCWKRRSCTAHSAESWPAAPEHAVTKLRPRKD